MPAPVFGMHLVCEDLCTHCGPGRSLHIFSGGHLGLVTEAPALAPVVERFLHPAAHHGPRPGRFRTGPLP